MSMHILLLKMDALFIYLFRQSSRLYWESMPRRRAVGQGTQEICSATWLSALGFIVTGLVSRLSLANHLAQSTSWWHTHYSTKMNANK